MAAMKLITSRVTPHLRTSSNRDNECCHCTLFSRADMAMLRINTSSVTPALQMFANSDSACCHCLPSHVQRWLR